MDNAILFEIEAAMDEYYDRGEPMPTMISFSPEGKRVFDAAFPPLRDDTDPANVNWSKVTLDTGTLSIVYDDTQRAPFILGYAAE